MWLEMFFEQCGCPRPIILLFDVGVKSIEQDADVWVIHLIAERCGIGGSIQKESLETVEWFDRKRGPISGKSVAQLLQTIDRPLPFIGRAAASRQVADGAVHPVRKVFRRQYRQRHWIRSFRCPIARVRMATSSLIGLKPPAERRKQLCIRGRSASGIAPNRGSVETFEAKERDLDAVETFFFDEEGSRLRIWLSYSPDQIIVLTPNFISA